MKNKWSHQKRIAATHRACKNRAFKRQRLNLMFRKFAIKVGTRDNPKSPVFGRAVIEMEANRDHLFKDGCRWLNMQNSLLLRPWSEAVSFHLLIYSDGHVLVPRNLPVRILCLVEEDSTYRSRISTQNHCRLSVNESGFRQFAHCGNVEKISYSSPATIR